MCDLRQNDSTPKTRLLSLGVLQDVKPGKQSPATKMFDIIASTNPDHISDHGWPVSNDHMLVHPKGRCLANNFRLNYSLTSRGWWEIYRKFKTDFLTKLQVQSKEGEKDWA